MQISYIYLRILLVSRVFFVGEVQFRGMEFQNAENPLNSTLIAVRKIENFAERV